MTSGITELLDKKYIYITNNNMLAIWIQTKEMEYIIPCAIGANKDNFVSNSVYTLTQIIEIIVK